MNKYIPMGNLEKQYLYLPMISRGQKKQNLFALMCPDNKEVLEQVGYVDYGLKRTKQELRQAKLQAMKYYILNCQPIPEKWRGMSDYDTLLDEAFKDRKVLQYAIHCVDYYKNGHSHKSTSTSRSNRIVYHSRAKTISLSRINYDDTNKASSSRIVPVEQNIITEPIMMTCLGKIRKASRPVILSQTEC